METAQQRIDQLARDIEAQDICPELRAQATQLVMGHGNPDASILVIGEAPGKEEDLAGLPFIGKAGKRLTEALDSVGLSREDDVYITNIVKYRPPKNRDPLKGETAAFLPYLYEEIEITRPDVIVTLGRMSMAPFVDTKEPITAIHGQPRAITVNGRDMTLMPMYHPSATFYDRQKYEPFLKDFQKLATIIKAKKESE